MLTFEDYARHPKLATLADNLGNLSALNANDRMTLIAAAATDQGVTALDVEMAQPGATTRVPFTATSAAPVDAHHEAVSQHVHRLIAIEGGRR